MEDIARVDLIALRRLREAVDLQLDAISVDNMGSQSNPGERHGQETTSESSADA